MMPPPERLDPPFGDTTPYPNDVLVLGDNRRLSITGEILSTDIGDPVGLRLSTLEFWEAAALRGTGRPLSDLLSWLGHGKIDSTRVRELDLLENLLHDSAADDESRDPELAQKLRLRINELKNDLVIDLGGGGIDPID